MSEQGITLSELKIALAEQQELVKQDIAIVNYELETKLLEVFRKWALPSTARSKVQDIQILGLEGRLSLVEDRLNDIDKA